MGRSSVNRAVQIGIETVQGTAVAANKAPADLSFDLNVETEVKSSRSQGFKHQTVSQLHKIWGTGSFSGPLGYRSFIYLLAMMYGTGTSTTPSGATKAREWLITPNAKGADNFKTFTIEEGDSSAATVMSGCAATDLDIDFGEDDIQVKGNILGGKPTVGSLTASPTVIAASPVSARHIDVYASNSLSTLFNTGNKITDAMQEMFKIGKTKQGRWVHNTDYQSFRDLVELAPDLDFEFTTEHNAQSRALFDEAVQNAFKYIGVRATGPVIETGFTNLIELTIAANITPMKREDKQGVYAYSYKCKPIYDATLGTSHKFRVVNDLASL
jgi:hypothetical protein